MTQELRVEVSKNLYTGSYFDNGKQYFVINKKYESELINFIFHVVKKLLFYKYHVNTTYFYYDDIIQKAVLTVLDKLKRYPPKKNKYLVQYIYLYSRHAILIELTIYSSRKEYATSSLYDSNYGLKNNEDAQNFYLQTLEKASFIKYQLDNTDNKYSKFLSVMQKQVSGDKYKFLQALKNVDGNVKNACDIAGLNLARGYYILRLLKKQFNKQYQRECHGKCTKDF